jgi:hypothetical protein
MATYPPSYMETYPPSYMAAFYITTSTRSVFEGILPGNFGTYPNNPQ